MIFYDIYPQNINFGCFDKDTAKLPLSAKLDRLKVLLQRDKWIFFWISIVFVLLGKKKICVLMFAYIDHMYAPLNWAEIRVLYYKGNKTTSEISF